MLIDRYLPTFDETHIIELSVAAPPDAAYAAILETDLRDPMIDLLFSLRELPLRLSRRIRGEPPPPPRTKKRVTFGDMAQAGPVWVKLGEVPDEELVIGSVGKFWRKDYGGRPVTPEEFVTFGEPGYAKLALGFFVRPAGTGAILRYEARTATTDEQARRTFRRYWRVIAPGVAIVMRRALRRIKCEAERKVLVPL